MNNYCLLYITKNVLINTLNSECIVRFIRLIYALDSLYQCDNILMMNTEKRNQHYIPKFYLRNFSYNGNKKEIGIFNLKNDYFFGKAKLKSQGSKNYFYGNDGIIEEGLSKIESSLAESINNIVKSKILPTKYSLGHIKLLTFVGLTHLRNPVFIQDLKNTSETIDNRRLELDPNASTKNIDSDVSHDDLIKQALSFLENVINSMSDLDYKILINKTINPFISSDFPIVKYNQFFEEKKWKYGKTGFQNIGLQIFIPINAEITIVLYDSQIYKVGYKKRHIFDITNPQDVDKFNILQFLNCYETVFFDEKAKEHYIRRLLKESKRYKRANQTTSELCYLIEGADDINTIVKSGRQNLLIMGLTDCEIKLEIDGIKMLSRSNELKQKMSLAQIRPSCKKYREQKHH